MHRCFIKYLIIPHNLRDLIDWIWILKTPNRLSKSGVSTISFNVCDVLKLTSKKWCQNPTPRLYIGKSHICINLICYTPLLHIFQNKIDIFIKVSKLRKNENGITLFIKVNIKRENKYLDERGLMHRHVAFFSFVLYFNIIQPLTDTFLLA